MDSLFVKDMASSKVYLFDEIAKHNKTNDCWLIISGKVYDVTSFMDDHPGGGEVLLSSTGKDATNDFEDVGHSDDARGMMGKYVIGEVDITTVPTKRLYVAPGLGGTSSKDDKSGFLIKILQLIVPLLILGLALAARTYTKKE
nr:cytochrome b5-like isoform X1 [Populus alba]